MVVAAGAAVVAPAAAVVAPAPAIIITKDQTRKTLYLFYIRKILIFDYQ